MLGNITMRSLRGIQMNVTTEKIEWTGENWTEVLDSCRSAFKKDGKLFIANLHQMTYFDDLETEEVPVGATLVRVNYHGLIVGKWSVFNND